MPVGQGQLGGVHLPPGAVHLLIDGVVRGVGLINPVPADQPAGRFGDIRIDPGAVACQDRGAEGRGLPDDGNLHGNAQHVRQDLAVYRALGGAAGENNFLRRAAGGLPDQIHVPTGDHAGVLHDGAVEGVFVVFLRLEAEVREGGGGVPPGDVVHDVREGAHHAVTPGGNLLCFAVHQLIGIAAFLRRAADLLLTEGVPVPAHHQAGLEGQSLVLPHAGNRVAVDPDPAVRVRLPGGGVVLILPEAAAEDGRLTGVHHADADGSQLAVAAAGHHQGSLLQAGVRGARGADRPGRASAFDDVREDIAPQSHLLHDGRIPGPGLQIHHARGGAVGGLHGQLPGQTEDQPVVEHAKIPDLLIDLRHLVLHPQHPGNRAQGIGLAGFPVDLLFQIRVHPDQLRHLVV